MMRLLVMCLAVVAAPAGAAKWHQADTSNFRVYSTGSAETLVSRAAMLEDYRALLETLTTRNGPEQKPLALDIFLVGNISEARPFNGSLSNVAGFYLANGGRILAYAEKSGDVGQSVLLHEYAHHFLLGAGSVAYPAWYVEGFAEYFMTATFSPEKIEFGGVNANRTRWLGYGTWLPLDKILSNRIKQRSGEDQAMFYAQSWLLTHYLFRTPEMQPKLGAYLSAVAAGADPVAAFKTHIDPDLLAFQRKLRSYLTGRKITFSRFTRPTATPADVKIVALPPAADPMLLQLAAVESGVNAATEQKALAAVRSSAARFPGEPLAERTLAFTELRYGDRATAIALLDKLLAAAPNDATLLRWRAIAVLPPANENARREARRLLAKAFKADQNDWRTMYQYVLLSDPYGKPLTNDTMNVLLRARELAPQVTEIALTTAMAMAIADRLPEAAAALAPIAHAPHGGGASQFAATLLDKAEAGDKAGMIESFRNMPVIADE